MGLFRKKKQPKSSGAAQLVARPFAVPTLLPVPPAPPAPTIPPVPVILPTDPTPSREFDENSIQSYHELLAALKAKKVQITLGNDIVAEDNILINYDVAINFNGHSIVSGESRIAARVLDIRSGEVTLTGRGKIFAMGRDSVALRIFGAISTEMPHYTSVTVDEEISLFSPTSYAIYIAPNLGVAYGLTLNFAGEIIAHDGIGLSSDIRGQRPRSLPLINLKGAARITADEDSGVAVDAAGYAIWRLGAVNLRGASGIRAKSGIIECSHTQIMASGEDSCAALQLLENETQNLEIAIDGGSYMSEKSYALSGVTSGLQLLTLRGGDFRGELGVVDDVICHAISTRDSAFSLETVTFLAGLDPRVPLLPQPETPPEMPAELPLPAAAIKTEPSLSPAAIANQKQPASPVTAPEAPVPVPDPAVLAREAEQAECQALKAVLSEALIDLAKLNSSDYDAGFDQLRHSTQLAEKLLTDDAAKLDDIRNIAGVILSAFDSLQEHEDLSLSDAELDELFYHGAVLEEVAGPTARPTSDVRPTPDVPINPAIPAAPVPYPAPNLPASPMMPEVPAPSSVAEPVISSAPASPAFASPAFAPEPPISARPDLSALSDLIAKISALDPERYASDSYQTLLDELTEIKPIIADPTVTQADIDQIVENLAADLADLEPAPAIQELTAFSTGFVDEAAPNSSWSTGVSSIDETAPFDYTKFKSTLSSRSRRGDLSPFSKFARSFAAGAKAGFAAYRKARSTAK